MAKKEEVAAKAQKLMSQTNLIRNIGVIAHIDHGKSTLTDSLVAASGLMSEELAGEQLVMDFYILEQERGITINAANISLVYAYEGKDHLINVIDTPGHVDFGGDVIRAMRAVDGGIIVVDAAEGPMPQTETVIRQALKENCQPVLFINKVDRLINELQLGPEEMQKKLIEVINKVNKLIKANAPPQFKEEWMVNVEQGKVAFGTALYKWAISIPQMKKTGITFKDIYDYCKEGKQKELSKKIPLYIPLMEMIITHLPNPKKAQAYRTKEIWKGDLESPVGKGMLTCDGDAPLAMMVTAVTNDKHAGEVATGRVYSGTLKKGLKVRMVGSQKDVVIQQVNLYMGPDRVSVENVSAGNIAAVVGLKDAYAGETVGYDEGMTLFESFKSKVEPVITVSVEAKNTKDLPKLVEVLRQITKADPNVRITINQETGEHLVSGMGELHLEITEYRIQVDNKVPITTSPPIVVYHETISEESPSLLGKSPNKHNHFKMHAEPLEKEMLEKIKDSGIQGRIRKKDIEIVSKLQEMGFGQEGSKKIWCVHNNNLLIDGTRGIQALHEIKELVIEAFEDAMNAGPLASEKCEGVVIRLEDAKLHEDSIHRGPAQVLPAITRTIFACMLSAKPLLMEPKQKLFISIPQDYMGEVGKELNQRRAQIDEINTEGDQNTVIAVAPVRDLIGFSNAIRGATQGRAIWTAEFFKYEPLPPQLQQPVRTEIRKRKGMDTEVKSAEFFLD